MYIAAARRFVRAFAAVLAVGVPIDPGTPAQVRDWTPADISALRELHEALGEMLAGRRRWDGLRRSRDPHG
jgi:hypothetical protein